jgi:hypothetical protein
MARIVAFLHETLDMTLVYLALVGIALPFAILSWFLFDTKGFLLAVVLLGAALALFLMPAFERQIQVFSATKMVPSPGSILTFTFAKQMVRSPAIGGIYRVNAKTQFLPFETESADMRITRFQPAAVPLRYSFAANFRVLEASNSRVKSKIAGVYEVSFNCGLPEAQNRAAHAI